MKKLGLFAAGVLFGTAGIKLLGSKDAKKVYAHTTAAALRAKECCCGGGCFCGGKQGGVSHEMQNPT